MGLPVLLLRPLPPGEGCEADKVHETKSEKRGDTNPQHNLENVVSWERSDDMAAITIMDRKEMRKIKDALHIDVRDGRLHVWGMFNQTVCIYPEEISAYDPDKPQTTGTLTVRLPDTPPSPPEKCPVCHHATHTGMCRVMPNGGPDVCCCTNPPEMPEVAPVIIPESIEVAPCGKYAIAVGKKPAKSCKGCTVPGCKMKGEQDSQSR